MPSRPSFRVSDRGRAATRTLVALLVLAAAAGGAEAQRAPKVVELVASRTQLELVPGRQTTVFAYNGTVPGPTLEFLEGDEVVVRFRNDLPEPTTVHWHGIHLPFAADGSPYHPVAPGETYEYRFRIDPGTAGTYWYHPHPHHATGRQVGHGLYGVFIVRDSADPLPRSLTERVLVLSDNRIDDAGRLDFPDPHSMPGRIDRENGREGDLVFVSGALEPTYEIRPNEVQRWRIVNASAARIYRLALLGQAMLHVGSDGGLFERPVVVEELVLAPSERVEVLVRGGAPGSRMTLQDLPYNRYVPQTRPADWEATRNLATLVTTGVPADAVELPETLRPVAWLDTTRVTATREIALSQGLINGRVMDMARVDVEARLGATEIWQVENLVGMDHPFHLHGFRFQVLTRNGVPEPFPAWKDIVNVPRHETVRFIVRYDDYPGKWMFHCHILDHEDHGMMGVLEVR